DERSRFVFQRLQSSGSRSGSLGLEPVPTQQRFEREQDWPLVINDQDSSTLFHRDFSGGQPTESASSPGSMFCDRTLLLNRRRALPQLNGCDSDRDRSGPGSRFATVRVPSFGWTIQIALLARAIRTRNGRYRWTLSQQLILGSARVETRWQK